MDLRPSLSCSCLFVAALALTISAASSRAEDRVLKPGKPEQVGMSGPRLEIVNQILTEETKRRRVTAASVLVARRGIIVLRGGWGTLAPDAASPKAGPEAVYILASITKPVTVTALMLLVERGQVSLTDPVQKYLPEFQGPGRETVRVQDLLTHTSGLPDMLPENVKLREANGCGDGQHDTGPATRLLRGLRRLSPTGGKTSGPRKDSTTLHGKEGPPCSPFATPDQGLTAVTS